MSETGLFGAKSLHKRHIFIKQRVQYLFLFIIHHDREGCRLWW
uniref:Uncharacterized protein n=1 Tax=Rhizophora mucronata TaxID=61149 RepID=A0A2P2JHK3_RHIMU